MCAVGQVDESPLGAGREPEGQQVVAILDDVVGEAVHEARAIAHQAVVDAGIAKGDLVAGLPVIGHGMRIVQDGITN